MAVSVVVRLGTVQCILGVAALNGQIWQIYLSYMVSKVSRGKYGGLVGSGYLQGQRDLEGSMGFGYE